MNGRGRGRSAVNHQCVASEDDFPRLGHTAAWTDPRRPPAGLLRMIRAERGERQSGRQRGGPSRNSGPAGRGPRRRPPAPTKQKRSMPSPEHASRAPRHEREVNSVTYRFIIFLFPAYPGKAIASFVGFNDPHDRSGRSLPLPTTDPSLPAREPPFLSSRTWTAPPSAAA